MAYIVGSASVEIVPDFKNAQLAITAWFAKQQNELKVPVKPDISDEATRATEQQARKVGTRVGKAMADASEKEAKAQRERDRRSQERLGEQMARDMSKATAKAIEDRARQQEKADADALRAQQRLGTAMAREVERAIAARARAEERAAADAARDRSKNFAAEERLFQAQLRAQITAMRQAIKSASEEEKIRLQVEIDEKQAILESRTTGGFMARAIHAELRQNAGLITGAVTGALLAGGPAIAAAASGAFIGIAAVGAFQSEKLRDDWRQTWDDIKAGGIADTAVLVPAFSRMASTIGESFQRMRPQIREGLAEAPILIDIFSDSLALAAENALPGLVRSVQNGEPVIRGFGDLMESLGQGTTDLLDAITGHAPAAGQSLSLLGDGVGELLPTLGELLGQGAELGTIVLPVLNSALGGLRGVVEGLGGSLPILATGFLAFRTIQGTGRFVNQLSQGMLNAAPRFGVFAEGLTGSANAGERVMTSTGRAAGAIGALGKAMPGIGIGVGVMSALLADAKMDIDNFAEASMKGGAAAAKARDDIANPSAWDTLKTGFSNFFDADMWKGASTAELRMKDTRDRVRELEASMSPLELAQSRLAGWTETLAYRLDDESASAEDVAIAQRKVAEYTDKTKREQEQLETAVRGVTEAMAEQADQARARVDASFGFQQAVLDTQEAHQTLVDTLNDEKATAADVAKAWLDFNKALGDQAKAAGDVAMANLPATMDDTQKAILGAKGSLDELNTMIANGVVLPPELEQWRQQLLAITNQADGAKLAQAQMVAAFGEVGAAVTAIPDTKSVQITAPTAELVERIRGLGFTVETVPGTKDIIVTAETDEAKGNLGNLSGLLTDVGNQNPTPEVGLNPDQFDAANAQVLADLAHLTGLDPTVVADLDPNKLAAGLRAAGGLVDTLDGMRPKPVADLNPNLFNAGAKGVFDKGAEIGRMRPMPFVGIIDGATGQILAIQTGLGGLRDKTIVITTINRNVREGQQATGRGLVAANGGAIEDLRPRYKFDGGGAIVGRGGPRDDLVPAIGPDPFAKYSVANGEHVLDGLDVALLGGQAGVYAFRDMLKAGDYSGPGRDTGVSQMVSTSGGQSAAPRVAAAAPRAVTIYTPDVPAAIRGLKAAEHQEAVLASPWP